MRTPVLQFGPNLDGRDFVVSDLHGCFALLQKLLEGVGFDPTKDRLFSVGDLVDRGPESMRCLELLYEPWFHAVIANHEIMAYEAFHGGPAGPYWTSNGGAWGIEALNDWREKHSAKLDRRIPSDDSERLFDLLNKIDQLPFLITVELKSGKKVHIIHAELPPGQKITDEILADPEQVLQLATVQVPNGDTVSWGRHIFGQFHNKLLDNHGKLVRTVAYTAAKKLFFNDELSHIISGHTILQRPLTVLGQTCIDTGAFNAYTNDTKDHDALTMVELDSWTFYQATPTVFRQVEPVVVTRADLDALVKATKAPTVNLDAPPVNMLHLTKGSE
jgi:serine/threonine protein phosphatase 1